MIRLHVLMSTDEKYLKLIAEQMKEFGWQEEKTYHHRTDAGTVHALQLINITEPAK